MSEPLAKVKDTADGEAPVQQGPAAGVSAPVPEQGNWFHRNRWFTKEPITYLGYQFFRSTMATIPYGFAMAAVHHGMGLLRAWGERIGYMPGVGETIKSAGDYAAKEMSQELFAAGKKAMLGRNLARIANSPLNPALQIGAGFTLFRFTGGLVKTLRDKVMDEKNTAADTNRETKNWVHTIVDTAKTNWPAESRGTPWAALTLGFVNATYKPMAEGLAQRGLGETRLAAINRVWRNPNAKILQNAAIWTIGYSTFFEIAERLFKDSQLRFGKWKGNENSLKNAPDDHTVGTPAKKDDQGNETVPEHKGAFTFLTEDPGLPRLIFRRVAPVAVGITAYAFLKRAGYVMAGGPMKFIDQKIATSSLGEQTKTFLINSWREGAATAMFGALWASTDAWGTWYDKFFEQFEKKDPIPLNEHQSQKFSELQHKLHNKEHVHAV